VAQFLLRDRIGASHARSRSPVAAPNVV